MIPKELGIAIIILAAVAAFLYIKMILIWRDVMLRKNDRMKHDWERMRTTRKHRAK